MEIKKSGFVAVVGEPNVGKSTLINHFLNEKLMIVTPKAQTTRSKILGILTKPQGQIVFMDTPGVCEGDSPLKKHLRKVGLKAPNQADAVVLLIDVFKNFKEGIITESTKMFIENTAKKDIPLIIGLNKIDLIKNKNEILPIIEELQGFCQKNDTEIIPISALHDNTALLNKIFDLLPQGEYFFPSEQKTDKNIAFRIEETIREKVLMNTHQEIPHRVGVKVENIDFIQAKSLTKIYAKIYVEKKSQKGILIGANGETIKKISMESRKSCAEFIDTKLFLKIDVGINKNWTREPKNFDKFGILN